MSITLDELIFDPANPDDGANVGATLRGADGTVIGNTGDALKVTGSFNVDGSTVALDAPTLAALENITVSATDLDIRDLAFATDKVDVTGSEVALDAASLAALENITVTVDNSEIEITNDAGNPIPVNGTVNISDNGGSITVDAADLDIRDLAFATDSVDVSGSSVDVNSKSSGAYKAASVTATAAQIDTSPLTGRKNITIQNLGTKDIWIGFDGSVTDTNGTKVPRGGSADFDWSDSLNVFAVTSSGTADVRLLETA